MCFVLQNPTSPDFLYEHALQYNVTLQRFVSTLQAGGNDIEHMLSLDAIITRLGHDDMCGGWP